MLVLLVKKFGKFLKRKSHKGSQRRYNSKLNESNSTPCYNYEKQGHIKIIFPNFNQNKDKGADKK